VFLDVTPGHEVGEAIGVEADKSINDRPSLCKSLATIQDWFRYSHIRRISISVQASLDKIYFIGLLSTFFFIAHTPNTILPCFGSGEGSSTKVPVDFILSLWVWCFYKLDDLGLLYISDIIMFAKKLRGSLHRAGNMKQLN
jgi:hypothetical protein